MTRSQPKRMGKRVDRAGRRWVAALSVAVALALASPTAADDYDPANAGHPVRIVAYLLHPVGVAIDYLIMRPAHWIGSFEPMKTLFGQED
jgi:hypothetical protein